MIEVQIMTDVFFHAMIESLKMFIFIFLIYVVMSFLETKILKKIGIKSKLSPLYGSLIGVLPQCGFSIVASDLYKKRHITMGTLIAVYLVCSDEAIPILLTNSSKILIIFPLIGLKVLVGIIFGYIIDLIFKNQIEDVHHHVDECEHVDIVHKGCCSHEIDSKNKGISVKENLIHPLIHSFKILLYIFIINVIFGSIIYYAGEDKISQLLYSSKEFQPLIASFIGLIPNCASSVILTNLYLSDSILFSALFTGLCCNAGLGLMYLFKHKGFKENIKILVIFWLCSIISGYILYLI